MGNSWIEDIWEFVEEKLQELEEGILDLYQSAKETLSEIDATYTLGISGSYSPVGFWGGSGQLGAAIDTSGNVEIQWSLEGGITTGMGLNLGVSHTVTNAPSVDALHGAGYTLGGSKAFIVGSLPAFLGLDLNILPTSDSSVTYLGMTVSGGMGTGDAHVFWGGSGPVGRLRFNIFDVIESIF